MEYAVLFGKLSLTVAPALDNKKKKKESELRNSQTQNGQLVFSSRLIKTKKKKTKCWS